MLNNDDRADYGRAGLMAGDPDHDIEDTRTSAGDAIANILHCAVREQAGWEATAWKQEHPDGPEFSREAWTQSGDCVEFVEAIITTATNNLHAELDGEA